MIQVKNVVDALFGLVGWRQDLTDSGIELSANLTNSDTGLFFNDAHPLLTLKNIKCIAPNFEQIEGTTESNFSDWLENKTRTSIANAINKFVFSVMPSGGSKTLLEHRLLYNSVGRLSDTIKNTGKYVGLEIHPLHSYDACVRLDRIGLQAFNRGGIKKAFSVVVANSNDLLNPSMVSINDIGSYKVSWANTKNITLNNTDGGQAIYVYYSQDLLASAEEKGGTYPYEAVNRTIDWSKPPCRPCSSEDYSAYMSWSKFLEVSPFYIDARNIQAIDGVEVFDQQDMVYSNNTNFGLNVELSIYCDYTSFLIRNRYEFVQLIMKQVAVDMLKEFVYNPNVRANRNSVNVSRTDVLFALDGSNEKAGLMSELEEMYKGLNVSMKGLDKVCRPCCNKGIRFSVT